MSEKFKTVSTVMDNELHFFINIYLDIITLIKDKCSDRYSMGSLFCIFQIKMLHKSSLRRTTTW